jgi:hypothetical protein
VDEKERMRIEAYVLVAFTAAESKCSRVVSHEGYAFAWVAWLRTEVTGFYSVRWLVWHTKSVALSQAIKYF